MIPRALHTALEAEFYVDGVGALGITDSVRADRARAMAAFGREFDTLFDGLDGGADNVEYLRDLLRRWTAALDRIT